MRVRVRRSTLWGLVFLGLVAAACASPAEAARAELLARLESGRAPEDFSFRFRAGGTRVNDCLFPNREFAGAVDADRELLVIRRGESGPPIVISTAETTFLHRDLFAEGSVESEWIRLTERGTPVDETLNRLLGPDLGGYAAPDELPPSGHATAVAVLKASKDVSALGASRVNGQTADGFRLSLETEVGGRRTSGDTGPAPLAAPVVDIWMTRANEVVRVEVRSLPASGTPIDDADQGWTTDYRSTPQPSVLTPPADVEAVGPARLARLSPRRMAACELPL